MGVRNRARRALLRARYASGMNGRPLEWNLERLREMMEDPGSGVGADLPPEEWAWAARLGRAVEEHLEELRTLMESFLENWSPERLSAVVRLVLEQSAAEAMHLSPPTPRAVVIDEALDLVRTYGEEEATGLVNAVLERMTGEGKC